MSQPLLEGNTTQQFSRDVETMTLRRLRDAEQEREELRDRVNQLEHNLLQAGADYGLLQVRYETMERSLRVLRRQLQPLYQALRGVFGELDALPITEQLNMDDIVQPIKPKHAAVWESWKHKLGGLPARFIDALLLHGPMTRTQLRIAVGCANSSVGDTVYKLNRVGLIDKANGKISLKEMQ